MLYLTVFVSSNACINPAVASSDYREIIVGLFDKGLVTKFGFLMGEREQNASVIYRLSVGGKTGKKPTEISSREGK